MFQSYLKLQNKTSQSHRKPSRLFALSTQTYFRQIFIDQSVGPCAWSLKPLQPWFAVHVAPQFPSTSSPFISSHSAGPLPELTHTNTHTPTDSRHGFAAAAQRAQLCEVVYIFLLIIIGLLLIIIIIIALLYYYDHDLFLLRLN